MLKCVENFTLRNNISTIYKKKNKYLSFAVRQGVEAQLKKNSARFLESGWDSARFNPLTKVLCHSTRGAPCCIRGIFFISCHFIIL